MVLIIQGISSDAHRGGFKKMLKCEVVEGEWTFFHSRIQYLLLHLKARNQHTKCSLYPPPKILHDITAFLSAFFERVKQF